jgi:hypothetical protein
MSQEVKKDKDYDFSIIEIIKAGIVWMHGVKSKFLMAFMAYILLALITHTLLGTIIDNANTNTVNQQIIGILSYPILMPFLVAIMMMALHYTRGQDVDIKSLLNYYPIVGKLALTGVMIYMLTMIGFILFVLPGMYASVAYVFAPMLIADKNMGVWEAMEHSRKTVTKQWFKVAGLMSVFGMIFFLGLIPYLLSITLFVFPPLTAFIPLLLLSIWTIPLMFITLYGLLYPLMFDEE